MILKISKISRRRRLNNNEYHKLEHKTLKPTPTLPKKKPHPQPLHPEQARPPVAFPKGEESDYFQEARSKRCVKNPKPSTLNPKPFIIHL